MAYNNKPIPKSILVFGAAGHIGGPLAAYVTREAPDVRLRLVTRDETKAEALRRDFPEAEVVIADYTDAPSLTRAVDGIEGAFVITPGGVDEELGAANLIAAFKAAGSLVHMIRFVGQAPEPNPHRIPPFLRPMLNQGFAVKKMLDESGLPVTYLNSGATFMDNFFRLGQVIGIQKERKLIWPERLIPWIDPRELGEVAARILLSDNQRHIGQFHTMNNGHDLMRFHEVADLLSDVLGEPIAYDGSKEAFYEAYAFMGPGRDFALNFFQYEQDCEVAWSLNDFAERILGRKPRTLREWLVEHREMLLAPPPQGDRPTL